MNSGICTAKPDKLMLLTKMNVQFSEGFEGKVTIICG